MAHRMDELMRDISAQGIANFISRTARVSMESKMPQTPSLFIYVALLLLLLLTLRNAIPAILENYRTPYFWFLVAMTAYFFCMAGIVFNAIHQPGLFYTHPVSRKIMLFYPSARQQFVIEGYIMAGILSGLGFVTIGFNTILPSIDDAWKQRGVATFLAFVFWLLWTTLMTVFRSKYPWYPM